MRRLILAKAQRRKGAKWRHLILKDHWAGLRTAPFILPGSPSLRHERRLLKCGTSGTSHVLASLNAADSTAWTRRGAWHFLNSENATLGRGRGAILCAPLFRRRSSE